jgi:hypothetical protein
MSHKIKRLFRKNGHVHAELSDGTIGTLCSEAKFDKGEKDSLRTNWQGNEKVFTKPKSYFGGLIIPPVLDIENTKYRLGQKVKLIDNIKYELKGRYVTITGVIDKTCKGEQIYHVDNDDWPILEHQITI